MPAFYCLFCLFTNALIQVSAANMCVHKAGMIHWNVGNLPLAISSIKNEPPFPGNSPVLIARQYDVGPSWISCILSILGFLLALSCIGLVQGTRAVATLSSNKHFVCRRHHFTILLSIFWLLPSSWLFCNVPWALVLGEFKIPFRDKHWVSYFQLFKQLHISLLTAGLY